MALPSDWKTGKCLEWYTELPYINRPRISQTFVFQETKCNFSLQKTSPYYYLYLKYETKKTLKNCYLKIYILDSNNGKNNFLKKEVTFSNSNSHLTYFEDSNFTNHALNLNEGLFLRFFLVFDNSIGHFLPLQTNIDEKSTQADVMLSLETDIENLSVDFGKLLENGDHSDVQVICDGGNIPAHRSVLAARSKEFSDMLHENRNGLMNFTTTEKSVMELCLEFIYKGKILNLPLENATNLYVLGHVLKISSLVKTCADLMIRNLCEDNYISYLVLSDRHSDEYFKSGLIDYICEHTELLKTETWMKFSDEYKGSANEVYQKCIFKYI